MGMSAGQTITAALHAMRGTVGELCMALERKQPVSQAAVMIWVKRLRKAADTLEALVK